MTNVEAIRGQLSQYIEAIQSDPTTRCATAQQLASAVYQRNANVYPRGLDWQDFVRAVEKIAVEMNLLLPGGISTSARQFPSAAETGTAPAAMSLNGPAISNARAEQIARQQMRRGGAGVSLSMGACDDDNCAAAGAIIDSDGVRQSILMAAIVAVAGYATMPVETLVANLVARDPDIQGGKSLSEFRGEVQAAQERLMAGAGFSMGAGNGNISNDRAEEVSNGMPGGQRREKKTPPGLASMIERMTPRQRERWEQIMAKQQAERAVNEEAKLDLLMDFLEGKVGQRV